MAIADELRNERKVWAQKISGQQEALNKIYDEWKKTEAAGGDTTGIEGTAQKLESDINSMKTQKAEAEALKDRDIQRLLSKITPKAFAHDLAKKVYMDPDVMRNANIAQVSSVQDEERLSDDEKDKSLEARYDHVLRAIHELDKKGGAQEMFRDDMEKWNETAGAYWQKIEDLLNEGVEIDGRRVTRGNAYSFDLDELKSDKVKLKQFKIKIMRERGRRA